MRIPEVHAIDNVCEGCNQKNLGRIVSGIEADSSQVSALRLCDTCGLIDLTLMQYCREIVLGCSDN